MKNLYLICLLFIISACGTPTTEERITFTQVDPFLKVFRESNFFPEYDETEEVAAGEHATFQFAVRAAIEGIVGTGHGVHQRKRNTVTK